MGWGNPGRTDAQSHAPAWDKALVEKLALSALKEQRRARRWSIFFRFAFLGYLTLLLVLYVPADIFSQTKTGTHTALVDVSGVITADSDASADTIVTGLRAAFEDENTAGVIIRINSPGGSAVQAGYINDEMSRLRAEYPDIPLYAVITDICASGGYYIAAAADQVYADKSSIVGSIGVIMNGFGFVNAMEKLGVERRLLAAGDHKALLDPFSPLKAEEVTHIRDILQQIHEQFIAVVRDGRGDRLSNAPELFSGLIWTGEESLELGLVDGLGSSSYVARELVGAEEIVDFTPRRDYFQRLVERFGASAGRGVASYFGFGETRLQ